ncbi:oxidoreductase [Novosphingobium sp.]|jgi:NAD(P)-dependent dehydrogenase (short-subunit alcohol dehydrogenase family)|uniref:oxidoreductase n=1 Tax=Novosphingobium sp. TaxID=1874826 RepID=UPI002FE37A3F
MTSLQEPIGSPFGAASTAGDVIAGLDLSGRTAIVTGGYSGLGLVTTKALSSAGAEVIVPARDLERAEAALAGIERVEIATMDLIDAASVADFASAFIARRQPLHLLINSAGVMATPLRRDAAGHEAQFATNHLGHFLLTCHLWPALAREGARVVAVSSRGHQITGVDFEDIDFERRAYDKWVAYGQSKTANVLFARALDRRGEEQGVRAFSLHPGQIITDLARHLSKEEMAGFDAFDAQGMPIIDPARGMKTVEQGAATALWCATSPLLEGMGGVYCEDCDIAGINAEETGRKGVAPWAIDDEAAERLWSVSSRWTGRSI